MPKIIKNVREMLIDEMRRQIDSNGYGKTSIRSVAKACGIAAGTVYNYFPSKDGLIAVFMAQDWNNLLAQMTDEASQTDSALEILAIIYNGLSCYINKHAQLFDDPMASIGFADASQERHALLVSQLSDIAEPSIIKHAKVKDVPITEFIIETLVNWTVQKKNIEDYFRIVSQLFD